MQTLRLELSIETLDAMQRLADITGAKKGIGELIQDAVRTYEWIIHEQTVNDKFVAGIPMMVFRDQNPEWATLAAKLDIDILPPIFDVNKVDEARKYFAKAA